MKSSDDDESSAADIDASVSRHRLAMNTVNAANAPSSASAARSSPTWLASAVSTASPARLTQSESVGKFGHSELVSPAAASL